MNIASHITPVVLPTREGMNNTIKEAMSKIQPWDLGTANDKALSYLQQNLQILENAARQRRGGSEQFRGALTEIREMIGQAKEDAAPNSVRRITLQLLDKQQADKLLNAFLTKNYLKTAELIDAAGKMLKRR